MMLPMNITTAKYQNIGYSVQQVFAAEQALRKFERAYLKGLGQKLWASLTHHSAQTSDLQQIKATTSIHNRHFFSRRTSSDFRSPGHRAEGY